MVTATAPSSSAPASSDGRVVLSGISWETYERLVDELERAGRRLTLTYDCGELEIESPSEIHELIKTFVHALLEQYLIEFNRSFLPVGQTTYKRRLQEKGLEADEAYYVTNIDRVSQKGDNDLERVPPPDLAIEVEVTVPLIQKLPIYAAIGVTELWHIDAQGSVRILRLKGEEYTQVSASEELPFFTDATLAKWIKRRLDGDYLPTLQAFRQSLKPTQS